MRIENIEKKVKKEIIERMGENEEIEIRVIIGWIWNEGKREDWNKDEEKEVFLNEKGMCLIRIEEVLEVFWLRWIKMIGERKNGKIGEG